MFEKRGNKKNNLKIIILYILYSVNKIFLSFNKLERCVKGFKNLFDSDSECLRY